MRAIIRRAVGFLKALRSPIKYFRALSPGNKFLLVAWTLVGMLFAAVMHFTTGASWHACAFLAAVMAGVSGFVSVQMCRYSDQRKIARTKLIIFFGVGRLLMLVTISLKGSRFDPTSLKLFVFSLSGMVLTAFFMPRVAPVEAGKTSGR